jgi:hypothetical protein
MTTESPSPNRDWTLALRYQFPKRESPKINLKSRPIFMPEKVTVNSPQITIKQPQIHHQKTAFNTPFFENPQQKH